MSNRGTIKNLELEIIINQKAIGKSMVLMQELVINEVESVIFDLEV